MALIAPSLLHADFAQLGEAVEIIKAAGAPIIHIDVMDGHFVPEITVGQPVVASLRKATDLVLDVHLLIERPERYVSQFVDLGADRLAVHAEATPHLHRVVDLIRKRGARAGVAINPATPGEWLANVLDEVDFLAILTADARAKEESFIPRSVGKVRAALQARVERRLRFEIQVEGGVGSANVEELVRAGADILVVGSVIFDNDSPETRLREMLRLAAEARQSLKV